MERADMSRLEELPNIGPAIARKLRSIGIRGPRDLVGRDPYAMFDELSARTGQPHDPCLLDVFIAATRFLSGEPAKPWWTYTAERKARRGASSVVQHAHPFDGASAVSRTERRK